MYHSSIIIHEFGARKFTQILFRLETDTNYLGFVLYQSSILLEFGAMLSNDLRKEKFPGVNIIIFVYWSESLLYLFAKKHGLQMY